ncbi:MAG: hypothetical protein DDT23_00002 [candidate division WS2 bacterium]|nr:hypothetical protein [Candidatus Lithacetigena glycinireducens]
MLDEWNEILRETVRNIEQELSDDRGWVNLSQLNLKGEFTQSHIKDIIKRSRYYTKIDPLAAQALRLWTDYTFGSGLIRRAEDDKINKIMDEFWDAPRNQSVLSCAGQRKNSHNLLRDGSIYFALFLAPKGQATIRRIDPLEITEIITDPDDAEDIRYYKRDWITPQGEMKTGYYKAWQNKKDEATKDYAGKTITATEEALVYRLEREPDGLPLVLPALDWIKLYRRFLASRVAVILALARFAWREKVAGGPQAVAAIREKHEGEEIPAGSVRIESLGSSLEPIKTDTGSAQAYQDGRMIKLQICAAFGIPEQYFGDISIGNLATAKTVELPMIKMFESYQSIWLDAYKDINNIVLKHNGIDGEDVKIDWDLPNITPEDASAIAKNISALIPVIPELAYSDDVLQAALMSLGIKDISKAIEKLKNITEAPQVDVNIKLAKALKLFQEVIKKNGL